LKKNKISKNWINKQNRDIYVRKSKDQGYRSRSAFKLIEIDQRFHFLSKTRSLLDLGSAPGSWSQVVSKKIKNGKILSVDIKEMLPISNTIFLKGDFTELKIQKKIIKFFNTKIDTMISDMASNTTGNKELDSLRTGNLCLNALEFSRKILKTNAYFVSKIFMGAIFKEIQIRAKEIFKEVLIFKPKSSRKESREIYVICRNLKVIND
jgi:23S rRNA (uridine2552-2'-O)-methyltransferase